MVNSAKIEAHKSEELDYLSQQLNGALFIATFGGAELVGARTKHYVSGQYSDLTDLEINVLAKALIVDVQMVLFRTVSDSAMRSLLGKMTLRPIHAAKPQAEAIIGAHTALLEALPQQVIARILRDQDTRRRQIRERRTHSNESDIQ